METQINHQKLTPVIFWLYSCALTIFLMIIVGAITRLTESGLSITNWHPISGAIPPLNDEDWQKTFEIYKNSPEFIKKNFWMNLEDFKKIFFWEWFHRLLGRFIGILYAIPFIYFLIRKAIPKPYICKLSFILFLGFLQGFMGWYMVKSGLIDQPAVSHYRLAAHLGLALLILISILWNALDLVALKNNQFFPKDKNLYLHGLLTFSTLVITVVWGAYTAGLDAGLVYNDEFPLMGGQIVPSEVWFSEPYWKNLIDNPAGVQFMHRWLAMFTGLMIFGYIIHAGYKNRKEWVFPLLGIIVCLQIGLGLFTLFSQVMIHVAVTHQAGAVILLCLMVTSLHRVRPKE